MRIHKRFDVAAACGAPDGKTENYVPWLESAHFQPGGDGGRATLAATDGKIAVVVPVEETAGDAECLVPQSALRAVRKLPKMVRDVVLTVETGKVSWWDYKTKTQLEAPATPAANADLRGADLVRKVVPPPRSKTAIVRMTIDVALLERLARALGAYGDERVPRGHWVTLEMVPDKDGIVRTPVRVTSDEEGTPSAEGVIYPVIVD